MSERDRPAARVHPLRVGVELGLPGEGHAGERLVHLEGVDVADRELRAVEDSPGRRDHPGEHLDRVGSGDGEAVESGARGEAERDRALLAHDEHGGRPVGERRGVAGGHPPVADLGEAGGHFRVLERGAERGEALDRGSWPHRLVGGDVLPDRDDLLREVGRGRTLVRPGGESVERGSVDVPPLGDELGRDALPDQAARIAGGDARAERVLAERGRVDRVLAHQLDTAGDDHVVRTGDDPLGCERHGLLARSALAVDCGAGHRVGEARREHRVARDVHRLATDLRQAPANHVVDQERIEVVAVRELREDLREEVDRVVARELPSGLPPAGRGTDGIDDDGSVHAATLVLGTVIPARPRPRRLPTTAGADEATSAFPRRRRRPGGAARPAPGRVPCSR